MDDGRPRYLVLHGTREGSLRAPVFARWCICISPKQRCPLLYLTLMFASKSAADLFFFFLWKCLELANYWKYSLSIWVCSFQMACGVWRVGFCEKIIMRNWAGHWFRIGMQAGALLLSKLSPFCLSQGWWNYLKKYNLRHFKDGKCSQLTFQPLIMTRL